MKISKLQLKQMIREEIQKVLEAKKPQNPKFAGGVRVKHKEHGVGLLINIKEAPLQINGRTHLYEIQYVKSESGPTTYYSHTSFYGVMIWR